VGGDPSRRVRVTAIDPRTKCGPRTTVEKLYRVEERSGDETVRHLVFFDRHGWYCQHGPTCPAVQDVWTQLERGRSKTRRRLATKSRTKPRTKPQRKSRTKPQTKARSKRGQAR
jgi:hypothetical protein